MQHKPQARTFGMAVKEVDRDLALFLEMRNREKEKEIKCEEILTNGVDGGRGFDWLLTEPDSPNRLPQASLEGRNKNPDSPTLTSRSSRTTSSEDPSTFRSKSMQPAKPANIKRSGDGNRRLTSSGGRSVPSRPATPTGRPSLPIMSKTSRSSTPNSRATGSLKTVAPAARSSTPTRVTARPSTPTARSSIPSSSKSVSRPATPTPSARSSTLSTAKSKSRSATPTSAARSSSRPATPTEKPDPTPSAPSGQSSKVATIFKNPVPARGASPTVNSRSSKLPEMSSLPLDAPNLSTSITKRPNSASRVRPTSTNSRSSLIEAGSTVKSRQQSSSPSRVRSAIVHARNTGPAMLSKSYGYGSSGDDVNPVLIGTQMVDRVVNMRKLAPPMFDNISSKSSVTSQEISGFGRSLSKKSLDMAIRHMDLTRSIAGDTRPSKVSTSASSVNVKNGPTKSKTATVSNSPPSTKSVVGSELNHNPNSQKLNERHIDNVDTNKDTLSLSPNFQQYP